jgi:predicted DsbA family dithiol-disulfide isomerase
MILRHVFIIALLLCLTNLIHSHAAAAGPQEKILEARLPSLSLLSEAQRQQMTAILRETSNYGECSADILSCILKDKPDPFAVRMAEATAFLIRKGASEKDIRRILVERGKFKKEENRFSFTEEGRPTEGNKAARIVLMDFAEFKCPYCYEFLPLLHRMVSESKGAVKLVFKHYPLKSHKGSVLASAAAEAAHRQGSFWQMADLLFLDMERQEREDLERLASRLGLDMERFKRDLDDQTTMEDVERDKAEGVRAGVTGTPSLFINGKYYRLPRHPSFLKDVINEEAEALGIDPPFKGPLYSD